jgi:hypothetical protein
MTSLTDLREVVDVVIGVDTHVHTHSAAAVDAATGGVLDVNRPGMSEDFKPWEGWSHAGEHVQEVPA